MKINRTLNGLLGGAIVAMCIVGSNAPVQAAAELAPTRVELSNAREQAIEYLSTVAVGPDAQGRANALEALSMSPARVKRVLPLGLRDSNEGVRTVSAMIAGRLRIKQARGSLEKMLQDRSPFARAAAVYATRRIGKAQDPSVLAQMLLGHPEPRMRAHAAFILGELGDESALGLLREASAEQMPRVSSIQLRLLRLQIAEAMVKLGDDEQMSVIRAALYPARPEELEATAVAIQIIGELRDRQAVDQLITMAKGRGQVERPMPAEVRLASATALAKMGQRAGGFVADEYANSPNPAIRAQSASVYGWIGDTNALPTLQAMMKDDSLGVRVAAAAAIMRLSNR